VTFFIAGYFGVGLSRDPARTSELLLPIDKEIPFVPASIWVYLWIFAAALIPLFVVLCPRLFRRTALAYATAIAVSLICFAAFPVTSTRLRVPPTMLDIARPSDWAVFILYSFDPLRVRHGIPFGVRIGLNSGLLAIVRRSPLGETLGRDRMFFNLEQAVARYCREGRTTRDSHFKNSSTAGSPLSSE
jgi:hypothetical protein